MLQNNWKGAFKTMTFIDVITCEHHGVSTLVSMGGFGGKMVCCHCHRGMLKASLKGLHERQIYLKHKLKRLERGISHQARMRHGGQLEMGGIIYIIKDDIPSRRCLQQLRNLQKKLQINATYIKNMQYKLKKGI